MTGTPFTAEKAHQNTDLTMQSRVARALTKTIVAAGTASAIATACWLLNRILDGNDHKRIENLREYIEEKDNDEDDEYADYSDYSDYSDPDDGFALLPVVSESDDESESAMGYTSDYFTPPYDVCMLSVSIQTVVDPLSDVSSSECRLCKAADATEGFDAAGDGFDLDEKHRALSFTDTECSSNRSVLSVASEHGDDYEEGDVVRRSRVDQWLYVRL
ncbi:hypothetical protein PPTG_05964 [Phytophthora nicotianae INRA-310]|uniref:Uncharacterized protein n=2 Tax=Phytophthora nicotianae TaxID=4792 RepID=W2QWN8_PHYN3|nr:hypothetical protein PPTG_05964 [Phytophthora nicotianae INRA-310]ETM32826.1 hypothetical protein L914_19862 [Phytophthora nicotianae]ETN16869.1 hypothetical protein PPTG_05964 [Phytophthora nicotianae INRA-310]